MKENKVYLEHILQAIDKIESWTQDCTIEDFLDDRDLLQSATIKQLEVIGEAATRIKKDFMEKYPQVSWAGIVGMRNRLIHEYMSVNFDLTWDVVKNELPILKTQIEEILSLER